MPAHKKTYHHKNLRQALMTAAVPIQAAASTAGLSGKPKTGVRGQV